MEDNHTNSIKVSIITVVLNGKKTIEQTIKNILAQTHSNIEYIIIDGGSIDGTIDIIQKYEDQISYWVSEPDNGIYDAMNKGIRKSTGEIIGILNSDDIYADTNVIDNVVDLITKEKAQMCYGDLVYVDKNNTKKIVRKWRSGNYQKKRFNKGWMPPHPTIFAKKELYEKYGSFNTNFPISADYELMLRFLYKFECTTAYIPKVLVKMRTGGKSRPSASHTIKSNIECYQAWKINGLNPNPVTFFLKPFSKIPQFIIK